MKVLIQNIRVVEGSVLVPRSIIVDDGMITEVNDPHATAGRTDQELERIFDQVIDGAGELIALPGVIDMHVHFRIPGAPEKEDWETGSRAAWEGGVTYVCDMPNNSPAITSVERVLEKKNFIEENWPFAVNHGLYIAATETNLDEIIAADEQKLICGVKVYFGTSTGDLTMNNIEALEALFRAKLSVPIVIHAEDDAVIEATTEQYKNEDRPELHSMVRSREAAISALHTIIHMVRATGASNVHITHISTADEVQMIREAKAEGLQITCDTTPHHLTFTTNDYATLGNRLRVNPPVREQADLDALWIALNDGTIDMIGSDHAPHTAEEKDVESYWKVPSGVPGVQYLLSVLLHAVSEDRLSWQRLVELTSAQPAARFHIEGRGQLHVGFQADITLVSMEYATQVSAEEEYTKVGWSPYTGKIFHGVVLTTLADGEILVHSEE